MRNKTADHRNNPDTEPVVHTPPPTPRTQADKWAANMRAARQFHAREGSLRAVPRKAVVELSEPDRSQTAVRLGLFVDNCRRRADKLSAERRAELDALGMRW
ncbi:helicase associated domain-containing protein [Actinacidiphila alni]|uniref:helicase associated domain-containing protein n=1 Tax=Actinacidiphila alni TaxID=380248 RepID=UPI0033C7FDAD